jgi:hypothetical protein
MLLSIFGNKPSKDPADWIEPWGKDRCSIFSAIAASEQSDLRLPDTDEFEKGSEIRFVAGAADALFSGGQASDEQRLGLLRTLREAASRPDAKRLKAFYDYLLKVDPSAAINSLINVIRIDHQLDHTLARDIIRWIATKAPDRTPVKVATGLLHEFGSTSDISFLMTIGRHEEFAMFALHALKAVSNTPERNIFDLARHLKGWGKISTVEALRGTRDPEIQHWLVRHGCANNIMDEYLAHIAATSGRLADQLSAASVDDDLLSGAAVIFSALSEPGPALSLRDYADGPDAFDSFLGHVESRDPKIEIAYSLSRMIDAFRHGSETGHWTTSRAIEARHRALAYRDRPGTRALVESALAGEDAWNFWQAKQVAVWLDIDTWECSYRRQASVQGATEWYFLMDTRRLDRVEKTLDLARNMLPLDTLATGPEDTLGFGDKHRVCHDVDFLVQGLKNFPGVGIDIVLLALRSPSIPGRNMALNAIKEWGPDHWTPQIRSAVEAAARVEPSDHVRETISDLRTLMANEEKPLT